MYKHSRCRTLLSLALLAPAAACASAPTPAPAAPEPAAPAPPPAAQATPAAEALPQAREIIDRYVQAIGGREAALRSTSTRSTGTFEMPAAGLKGELVVLTAEPNKMVSVVTLPGLGEIRNGYNGTVGWAMDPTTGPRLMSGGELAALRDQAQELASVRDPSLLRSAETVQRAEMGGQPCYKVKLVWNSGRETFDCYSTETGLLVATTATQESPMGAIEVTTLFDNYQDFGGVRTPARLMQQMMGQQILMTIDRVEYDTVEPGAFELPAEIQTLTNNRPSGS